MVKLRTKQSNTKIFALKVKTESNNLGVLKTFIVALLILLQTILLVLSYTYLLSAFRYYTIIAGLLTFVACVHALSSKSNGQSKAVWIMFMLICYSFGYVIYLFSNEKLLFGKSKKKYTKIYKKTENLIKKEQISNILCPNIKGICNYLQNSKFNIYSNKKSKYFSSGAKLFDDILTEIKNAKEFIFIEFYIISDGVLLNRFKDILLRKAQEGVDVRIIYDDMGSHGKFKNKTKKEFKKAGIKLQHFNRLVPIFNLALNLRNHRKLVLIDGKVAYTGGANLADEYINEKQIYGYWKDCGVKLYGSPVDTFTLSFLRQWEFITKTEVNYEDFLNKNLSNLDESNNKIITIKEDIKTNNDVVVPFVSGLEYGYSVAKDMFINMISSAEEKLYIMTPYFIPEETIFNLLVAKAKSGVDVKIILPGVADKKIVYTVSRDYAEKLISYGVKVYTMINSFVHSKVIINENCGVVGSINLDLRSFYQQFESGVYFSNKELLNDVNKDFDFVIKNGIEITKQNRKRNKLSFRVRAGLLKLVSPLM